MAEEHAATLVRQRVIEEKKMKELEKIREQLEKCLEEEKQAKKDEEIVRQLQARVLEEEWGRRDQLEKLQVMLLELRSQYENNEEFFSPIFFFRKSSELCSKRNDESAKNLRNSNLKKKDNSEVS